MIALKPTMSSRNTGPGNRRFSTCWAVERTDGVTIRVTDHNGNLVVNNFIYHAAAGFSSSARERNANLQERNLELRGFLSSDYITEDDLRGGRYQDARVIELTVDSLVPWAGIYATSIYYIQQISFSSESWTAQVIGLTERIRRPRGDTYTRLCRWDLGSNFGNSQPGCKIDLLDFTDSGVVTSVTTQRNGFRTSLGGKPNEYYNRGILTWTSGANLNVKCEVQSYHPTDSGKFVMFLGTPYDIAAGDTFDVSAGCNKEIGTDCLVKFNNVTNHGGFPFIPGTDNMLRVPAPK